LRLKQMRHYFCATQAPIQHRLSGNSAAAAPTPMLALCDTAFACI